MLNFLGYMTFSSFEYLAMILLMLSIFNYRINHYKNEVLLLTVFITFLTYFLVIFHIENFVPLPLILFPILILSIKIILHEKWVKSILIVLAGASAYTVIQLCVTEYALHLKYLTNQDFSNSFFLKAYILQTLCSTIGFTITIYLRIFNGGFGFSLNSKKKSYKSFLYTTIVSTILSTLSLYAFIQSQIAAYLTISAIMFIVTTIIILVLSHNRDRIEFI